MGLPTAALFADSGFVVVGADPSKEVQRRVRLGNVGPEPGLSALLSKVMSDGRLVLVDAPLAAGTYLICVPTPLGDCHRADLDALEAAVASVGAVAPQGALVLLQSTVPVGTTHRVASQLRERDPSVLVAACPERVLPGQALQEMVHNDRIVGGVDAPSARAAEALLRTVVRGAVIRTDARTAELTKLVENASRDVHLALANSVAHVAEQHGLDPFEVRRLANRHPRVSLLQPGPGVGGHCIPVDPWFLMAEGIDGVEVFQAARGVNDAVETRMVRSIWQVAPKNGCIGFLGLAYKPDVDDVRNSPALNIARRLALDYDVMVNDPYVPVPDDLQAAPLAEAMAQDLVVLAVAHACYRTSGPPEGVPWLDLCGGWR